MNKVNLSYWFKTSYRNSRTECLSLGNGVLLAFFYFRISKKSSKRDDFYLNYQFWRFTFLVSWLRSFGLFIAIYKISMESSVYVCTQNMMR